MKFTINTKDYKTVDNLQGITINMEGMSSDQKTIVWKALHINGIRKLLQGLLVAQLTQVQERCFYPMYKVL